MLSWIEVGEGAPEEGAVEVLKMFLDRGGAEEKHVVPDFAREMSIL